MIQNDNERMTVAALYYSVRPGNPTFKNLDVFYKNRPVLSVRQGNNGSYYHVDVLDEEGREVLVAEWDEPVTVNVEKAYTGKRVELDI